MKITGKIAIAAIARDTGSSRMRGIRRPARLVMVPPRRQAFSTLGFMLRRNRKSIDPAHGRKFHVVDAILRAVYAHILESKLRLAFRNHGRRDRNRKLPTEAAVEKRRFVALVL